MSTSGNGGESSQRDEGGERRQSETASEEGGGKSDSAPYEKGMTILSVIVTILVFSTVVWQAVTVPEQQAPTVVVVGTAPYENDSVRVSVEVRNPSSTGFEAVSVSVACTDPPIELTYQHVPASGERSKYAVCPNWNQSTNVSIASWTEA